MNLLHMLEKHNFCLHSFYHIERADQTNPKSPTQVNDDSHLIHVVEGERDVVVGSRAWKVTSGAVLAVPLGTPFVMYRPKGRFVMRNIHYSLTTRDGTPFEHRAALPVVFEMRDSNRLVALLERMCVLQRTGTVTDRVRLAAMAHEVVLHHLTKTPLRDATGEGNDGQMQAVVARLADPNLVRFDAERLAQRCHLSVSQMNRRFRAQFGRSPHRYWEQHRFRHAVAALRVWDPNSNLDTVAGKLGFASVPYFVRWFKKASGSPPLRYKRSVLDAGTAI